MADELIAGVMGGLGPEATLDFFARVIRLAGAERDQDHIRLIINNNPKTPNRNDALAGRGPSSAPALIEMARSLEAAGADFLVMACNAAHAYEGDIRASTHLPFVSILDETVAGCLAINSRARKVGVLAVEGARRARLYEKAFEAREIGSVVLDDDDQANFMRSIYRIKAGDRGELVRAEMRSFAGRLVDRGADMVAAGCTEVPLVLAADDLRVPLIDSTQALAAATIAYARRERPLPSPAS